jgi:hypothetical protein
LRKKPRVTPKATVSKQAKAAVTTAAINSNSRGAGNSKPLIDALKCRNCGHRPPRPPRGHARRSATIPTNNPATGITGKVSHPTKPRNTPSLDVSRGFVDVFKVSGGNLNNDLKNAADLDALRGVGAMQELIKDGFGPGSGPITDGKRLGRERFGAGMDGPPMGAGDAPSNGGIDGWGSKTPAPPQPVTPVRLDDPTTSTSVEKDAQARTTTTTTFTVDGGGVTEVEVIQRGDNPETEFNEAGTRTTVTHHTTDPNFVQTRTWEAGGNTTVAVIVNGITVKVRESQSSNGNRQPARGLDNVDQPAPHDGSTGRGTGGCGVWTPLGGCSGTGLKAWEITGQPGTDEQGTVTVGGAARPTAGPGAVTNGGDGGFVSGGRGGGSGFGYNPCATQGTGCGAGADSDGFKPGAAGPGPV